MISDITSTALCLGRDDSRPQTYGARPCTEQNNQSTLALAHSTHGELLPSVGKNSTICLVLDCDTYRILADMVRGLGQTFSFSFSQAQLLVQAFSRPHIICCSSVTLGGSDIHLDLMEKDGSGAIESPASFYPNDFNLKFISATLTDQYWAS